ncbi:hypothetical protein TanjilG_01139 [Lupinus angustifolius]|uniref:Uncharacterized protein n=1 Tax=Lupinus angustifolius TaxID=3871 RepID=A0A1J7G3Y6_LUPAN|nr:hypothetical protein TanjilG_01139 [Lupinus angustifolius]
MLIIYQDSPSPPSSSHAPPSSLSGPLSPTPLSYCLPRTPPPSWPGVAAATPSSSPTPLSCMIKKAEKEAHLFLENNRKLQNTKEALEAKRTQQIRILMSMR